MADGTTARFKVTSVVMYLKTHFQIQAVYASHGISALQLVTCGGVFDTQSGHYLSNLIVYTSRSHLSRHLLHLEAWRHLPEPRSSGQSLR